MRRTGTLAGTGRIALTWLLLGMSSGLARDVPKPKEEKPPRVDEIVADIAMIRASDNIQVQGVGLVVGLDQTGSNPEPSVWRSQLLDRMQKAQVENPEGWLESLSTSLVLVKGTIPLGITTEDYFDIDLELTPASSTTSLAGGYLLRTDLHVVQMVDGQLMDGQVMASALGPVMTGSIQDPENLRKGHILGGAQARRDLPYQLILVPERQGYRTVTLLQGVINSRFYMRKGVEQVGMAEATRPELLVLKVPRVYHHNQMRYFQVIERLPLVDTPALRAQRMERWAKELLDPKTSGQAALNLEGIGRNAIPILKEGLTSAEELVRMFSAESLAYLNDPSGAEELARVAAEKPAYRAFALAALAAMDQPASVLRLRELLSHSDPKVRYGAFNSLRVLDPFDPFLGRVQVMDRMPEEISDDTALRVHSVPARKAVVDDPFELYLVECDGPPLVHLAQSRRCEIVIFGSRQKLLTPIVLGGTGPILLNASLDDTRVQISRIRGAEQSVSDIRGDSSTYLGEIIVRVANLGASYPEVVSILRSADRQKNLEGALVEDALPGAKEQYDIAQLTGEEKPALRDEELQRASGAVELGPDGLPVDGSQGEKRTTPESERVPIWKRLMGRMPGRRGSDSK